MKRSGFTLTELMVVVGIIGVLAAILFPVISAAKQRAKASAAVAELSQIGLAIQVYATDNDDLLPHSEGNNCYHLAVTKGLPCESYPASTIVALPPVTAVLSRYGAEQGIFDSPVDKMSSVLAQEPGHAPTWYLETTTLPFYGSSFEYNTGRGIGDTPLTSFTNPAQTEVMQSLYMIGEDGPDSIQHLLFADWHVKGLPHSQVTPPSVVN